MSAQFALLGLSFLLGEGGKPWCDPAIDFSNSSQTSVVLTYSVIVPDPSTNFGTWDGWGVSLCWWANIFGDRDDLADAIFTMQDNVVVEGSSLPGLGMNIARYNAGGSAWKTTPQGENMVASSNIPSWKQIAGFWEDYESRDPDSNSWNWIADAKQRMMLQKAHDRGVDHLELFSNSPMWWMLGNHNPSGSLLGLTENLQSWNRVNHSYYLATIAAHAKANWGITFSSVEPFNEPFAKWWNSIGTQEGSHFARATQNTVVKDLRQQLDIQGLSDMLVSASDENTYDSARGTWGYFDNDAKNVIGRVNVHGYQGANGRRDLLFSDVAGKPLWNSEYGDGDGSGLSMAQNLNLDFRWLHNSGYCYWQILDESGGWGLLKFDSQTLQVEHANAKYWVLAQYTRHIRPGMLILDNGGGENTVVAYDSEKRKLVLIGINTKDSDVTLTFDLTTFSTVLGPVTRWATNTAEDAGDRYAMHHDLSVDNGVLVVPFAEKSVQTVEIENVDISTIV